MRTTVFQRIAAGLAGAYNSSLRQHEHHFHNCRIRGERPSGGVRTGRRPGCAAERFEAKMGDILVLRNQRDLTSEWKQATESALFDEF